MRTLTFVLFTLMLAGQERDRRPEGRRGPGGFPGMNPVFAALDTARDGSISQAERNAAPQALRKLDRNSDGQLTREELGPGPGGGPRPQGGDSQEMIATLMRFDANGDGVLDQAEVPERMQGMFARGDKNKDGKLAKDELTALAQAQQPPVGGRGERGPGGPPRDPLVTALDSDRDGAISQAEIANAAAALATLDRNGDGNLSGDEVRPAFGPGGRGGPGGPGRFGRDPSQMVGRLIEEWDQNGDGKISKTEMPERMRPGFDEADANRDGTLSRDELQKMMQQRMGEGRGRER